MTLSIGKYLKGAASVVIALTGVMTTSCGSLVYDTPEPCTVQYRVSFRYTANLLDADAFGSQVTAVNLYVYDKTGSLVLHKKESRQPSTENNFYMELDLSPGEYDMLAWCEGNSVMPEAASFTLTGHHQDARIENLSAFLTLENTRSTQHCHHCSDLNRLYYGIKKNVTVPETFGTVDLDPIYLVKDTNHLTVQLQNTDGQAIDPDKIEFEIEGTNSHLDWSNIPSAPVSFHYHPWSTDPIHTGEEVPTGVKAEFTTGRIMADREQILSVRLKDSDKTIFSIPLVEYLLLVRNNYEMARSAQDYLDRYDDFTMVFFIDKDYSWISSRVIINGWRVLPPQNGGIL